jgi:DNA integrity scanning protein DisA with diadenylate cyclase activity
MLINPTKITCMLIGTAQRIAIVTNELNINLENQFIKNVNTQKLLGIYIDNNLNWIEQVDHVCKNINSRLFSLSKIQKYLDKKSRILSIHVIFVGFINILF